MSFNATAPEPAGVRDPRLAFGAGGAHYAASRPGYPADLFAFIAAQCAGHSRAWDCACGNGQAAHGLAQHFAQVCATDLSSGQLAAALPHPAVHYSTQAAESPAFAPASFDAIGVAQALHWFDLATFWPAVHRVLRPGGIFAAWGYAWFTVAAPVDQIIAAWLRPLLEPFWAPQNRLLWRGYQEIAWPFAPMATPSFAIRVTWTEAQLWAYLSSWSAMQRCAEAGGAEELARVRAAISDAWGDPQRARHATMPLVVRSGRLTGR